MHCNEIFAIWKLMADKNKVLNEIHKSPLKYRDFNISSPSDLEEYDALSDTSSHDNDDTHYGGYDALSPNTMEKSDYEYDYLSPKLETASPKSFEENFNIYRHLDFKNAPFTAIDSQDNNFEEMNMNVFSPSKVFPGLVFKLSIWAFLKHQVDEMKERATAFDPSSEIMSFKKKMYIRRGALVNVTLSLPNEFALENPQDDNTRDFVWNGEVEKVTFMNTNFSLLFYFY